MTIRLQRRVLPAIVLAPLFVAFTAQNVVAQNGRSDAERLRKIEAYVEQARKNWNVPGLGLAIVKNDSVIFAKGFGTRTIGQAEPVDENTLFSIGSSSKAFTAASVAMLVDEGKIRWNDRVTRHLPTLKFQDEYVTREMTVRDLLSHVSGLPRYDQLWSTFNYTPDEMLRRIQYLPPTSSFRSTYGYQNLMFVAAGEMVRAAGGKSWNEFVASRIFQPLGMTRSNTTDSGLKTRSNVASPHTRTGERTVAIPYKNIDNVGPAGSITSSAREMAEWVRLQLAGGVYNGRRLLSDSVMREMHSPHTIIPRSPRADTINPYSHFSTYGLAWFVEDHRGRKIVQHGGNIDGMTAMVAMMPGERVGFVLLENLNGSGMRTPLMHYIFDRFIDAEERDWSGEYLARASEARARALAGASRDSTPQGPQRISGTQPSRPLARYVGTYENTMFGDLVITEENGRLVLRAGNGPAIHAELEHWHFDTFRTRSLDTTAGPPSEAGRMMITFALDARGEPRSVTLGTIGEFTRRAAGGRGGRGGRGGG